MVDPIAAQTLEATWIGSLAATFAALSAVWISHQTNVRDDRRREREASDQKLAFETAVRLAVRKVASMPATIEDTGSGELTRGLFVRGVASAEIAIDYALKLGVADATSLAIALDARGALDLLSEVLASLGPDQFIGNALTATRSEIAVVMTAFFEKHPAMKPARSGGSVTFARSCADKDIANSISKTAA